MGSGPFRAHRDRAYSNDGRGVGGTTVLEWPEAIARLAAERTRAVTCAAQARALRAAGNGLDYGYGMAKAEVDGVIAALSVALSEGRDLDSLETVKQRLETGLTLRLAFCQEVAKLMPAPKKGDRGVLSDLLGAGQSVKHLVDALLAIVKHVSDTKKERRDTIREQLEATPWPEFAKIASGA